MKIVNITSGLGNQMFQYAFMKSLEELDKNIYLDLGYYIGKEIKYDIERIFGLKNKYFIKESKLKLLFRKIMVKIFKITNKIVYIEKWNNEDLNIKNKRGIIFYLGYWQSEKYFKNIESQIRMKFKFPKFLEKSNISIEKIIRSKNSVSIHVRRGDYLNHKGLGGLAPLEYYQRAIEYIKSRVTNPYFFIFSNDIEWCEKNLKLENTYYIDWNKGENSFRDMQLMALCKHNIIPNSSFSWWGAWLNNNPNKIVVAPEKWFNDCVNLDYSNIVPETWIKIRNY